MKIYLDCYPCFLRQAIRASRLNGASHEQQMDVIRQTLSLLETMPPGMNPPEIGYQIHQIVQQVIHSPDPYLEVKKSSTREALAMYPKLKQIVAESSDRLDMAIRLSIAGNIIDFGMSDQIDDLWATVARVIQQPYAIDHTRQLRSAIAAAGSILYLADNAGETVFDRVLIEELAKPVRYVVKSSPYVNDATREDALEAGLAGCAAISENGAEAAGTVLALCSAEFRGLFEHSPLIIAKGQANFETLSLAGEKVFCLLQAKCPVIADDLQVPVKSIIVHQCTPNRP